MVLLFPRKREWRQNIENIRRFTMIYFRRLEFAFYSHRKQAECWDKRPGFAYINNTCCSECQLKTPTFLEKKVELEKIAIDINPTVDRLYGGEEKQSRFLKLQRSILNFQDVQSSSLSNVIKSSLRYMFALSSQIKRTKVVKKNSL